MRTDARSVRHAGGLYRFDAATLEHRLGAIIPDVIVHRADRTLLVEFRVTHPCDFAKIAKIVALGVAAVEIDLSGLAQGASRQALEEAILSRAPRRWLYNPRLPQASIAPEPKKRAPHVSASPCCASARARLHRGLPRGAGDAREESGPMAHRG